MNNKTSISSSTAPRLLALLVPLLLLAGFSCTYTQKVKDGQFAFERKQYAVAVDLLQKEYKKAKSRVEKGKIAFLLGESYKMQQKMGAASNWYKSAYDNGYGSDALREYAYTLKAMEQYDEALSAFRELGIEIGSPYEYRREMNACQIANGWQEEKFKAFSVEQLPWNSSSAEYSPSLFENRQIVFTSDRSASAGEETYKWTGAKYSDLFLAGPDDSAASPFSQQINSEYNEGTAVFNANFTEMYFTRCYGSKREDNFCRIMQSRRIGDQWSAPEALGFEREGINYGQPALSADGKILYFSSNDDEGWGGYDIWYSERTAEGWGTPKLMNRSINTTGNEKFPTIDRDTLYFSSDFHPGMGGLDIFKTWRLPDGGWAPVQNLKPPLNSGSDDFGYIPDPAGKKSAGVVQVGYFSSNRPEGSGGDDIYRFERRIPPPEPVKPEPPATAYKLLLDVYVLEKVFAEADNPDSKLLGRKPLTEAGLKVISGKEVKNFTVSENGYLQLELEENKDYQFIASKDGYLTGEGLFSTKGLGRDAANPVRTFELEIVLDRIYLNREIVLEDIYYDFDKWDIREDARPTLDKLARDLELNPSLRIQLSSHTDCRGNDGYNLELSQRRAQSAVDYLISKGISAERLQARGFGESQPKAACICSRCTEGEHQVNRRTAFAILEKESQQ
ncbi:MAG: hypothetical protein RI973_1981 [Bacteroidota bacterium]|jgi:outer membrane protein OmpA-like peptidoglycan-associated protein